MILYSDINSFYTSVEIVLNPELQGKPRRLCRKIFKATLAYKNELSQFVAFESAVKRAGNYRLYTKVRLADILNPKEGRH